MKKERKRRGKKCNSDLAGFELGAVIACDGDVSLSVLLTSHAAATYTSSPELFISFAMQEGLYNMHTTRMDHHIALADTSTPVL